MGRVAVTGATGGLGRSVCEWLLARGYEVVALGRNPDAGEALRKTGAEFTACEITDLAKLTAAFEGCDAVIHSAGLASSFGAWESFFEANVRGTETALAATRAAKVKRFIHISTPSVYFSGDDRFDVREDSLPPPPQNFYSKSKLMADELVLKAVRENELDAVLLRPRAIIGPYDTTIVPRMLKIMKRGVFPLPNGGRALINLTAVENVAYAIQLCIEKPGHFKGDIYNITNGVPMPIRELTRKLADALGLNVRFISVPMPLLKLLALASETIANLRGGGREPAISKYAVESIGTTQTLSIEKAEQELNYKPLLSLDDALTAQVARIKRLT